MTVTSAADHWQNVYAAAPSTELSWFTREPIISLRLIEAVAANRALGVIDIGAGASLLVDRLLGVGFTDVTVLDISQHALDEVQPRLAERSHMVTFVRADVLTWNPGRQYDIWHDRAVFHFLTERTTRDRYVAIAADTIPVGGTLVLATFALDGPAQCSGLPVSRYSAFDLEETFFPHFSLVEHEREEHHTPWDAVQRFTWAVLRRK